MGLFALKIVTTTLNVLMMAVILFFMNGLTWERNKISVIGFTFMQALYLLNTFCMWGTIW